MPRGRPRKTQSAITLKRARAWQPLAMYPYQQEVEDAYKNGTRKFFLAWHRRAGKDVFGLDFARNRAYERVGTYWHLFPFHVQARRAIWKGIDARTGERFIDRAFPPEIRESTHDTEMSITFGNGSTWQMLGSDNYDRMIGSNPCGIIFSEWALCDPAAWEYIRPILMENKGWAMFITTFRGRNHAWRHYKDIEESPEWYASLRSIDQTTRNDKSPVITREDVEKEISEGMDPALAQQEFFCNPSAATSGAIFNQQHQRISDTPSLAAVPLNQSLHAAWGIHEEGIAAIVFHERHIHAIHTFCEQNLIDAAQAITRRHPHAPMIHHAISPDPLLFSAMDGAGVVAATLGTDPATLQGHAAAVLNTCQATAVARERLIDFTAAFAPYRSVLDETDLTLSAIANALAVVHTAYPYVRRAPAQALDYSRYDRGVI